MNNINQFGGFQMPMAGGGAYGNPFNGVTNNSQQFNGAQIPFQPGLLGMGGIGGGGQQTDYERMAAPYARWAQNQLNAQTGQPQQTQAGADQDAYLQMLMSGMMQPQQRNEYQRSAPGTFDSP